MYSDYTLIVQLVIVLLESISVTRVTAAAYQAWGKHLGQMLEALPQGLGKVLKHKHKHKYKCFKHICNKAL